MATKIEKWADALARDLYYLWEHRETFERNRTPEQIVEIFASRLKSETIDLFTDAGSIEFATEELVAVAEACRVAAAGVERWSDAWRSLTAAEAKLYREMSIRSTNRQVATQI